MQWLVNSRPFEYCIILTIVGNCVVMSMDTHLPNGDKTILALQLVKLSLLFSVKLIAAFTGGAGALLYGNLHSGDVHQDCCHGLRPPPGLLSQERLEHHGLHRGRLWVSAHVDAEA